MKRLILIGAVLCASHSFAQKEISPQNHAWVMYRRSRNLYKEQLEKLKYN